MSSFVFLVEDLCVELTHKQYSKSRLLLELTRLFPGEEVIQVENVTKEEFALAVAFCRDGVIPSIEDFFTIEYFDFSFRDSYELSCLVEDDMRRNMYSGVENGRNYFADHYGLYILDEQLWDSLRCTRDADPNLLFGDARAEKASWVQIQERLELLRPYLQEGVLIAGGAIFSILFGKKIQDIDLFIYGKTEDEARDIIFDLKEVFAEKYKEEPKGRNGNHPWKLKVSRTANAITFHAPCVPDVQVITRLYRTPSEICSGFDLESCAIGWEGKQLLVTYRGLYALEHMTNTVNFGRLSPSYERRLAKYAARGVAVRVPDFDRSKVNDAALEEALFRAMPCGTQTNFYTNVGFLHKMKGLDVLLFLEKFAQKTGYSDWFARATTLMAAEYSDYGNCDFKKLSHRRCAIIENVLDYLHKSSFDPRFYTWSERYSVYFQELQKKGAYITQDYGMEREWTASELIERELLKAAMKFAITLPFKWKSYSYLCCKLDDLPLLLDFPSLLYDLLSVIRPFEFTPSLQWKTTQPGEQMTNTFHQIVLEDNSVWYQGKFYATHSFQPQHFYFATEEEVNVELVRGNFLKVGRDLYVYDGEQRKAIISGNIVDETIFELYSVKQWRYVIPHLTLRFPIHDCKVNGTRYELTSVVYQGKYRFDPSSYQCATMGGGYVRVHYR